MGMYPGAVIGYGWVIRDSDRTFMSEFILDAFVEAPKVDFASWLNDALKAEGIDVIAETFGYDYAGVALIAAESKTGYFRWENAYYGADRRDVVQLTPELQDAVDLFDLHEARLGPPKWLLLLSYG